MQHTPSPPPFDHVQADEPDEADEAKLGRTLGAPVDACDREARLYTKYLRALALLSECAPYVDEPDYAEQIQALLADAGTRQALEHYRVT